MTGNSISPAPHPVKARTHVHDLTREVGQISSGLALPEEKAWLAVFADSMVSPSPWLISSFQWADHRVRKRGCRCEPAPAHPDQTV